MRAEREAAIGEIVPQQSNLFLDLAAVQREPQVAQPGVQQVLVGQARPGDCRRAPRCFLPAFLPAQFLAFFCFFGRDVRLLNVFQY